MNAQFLLGGNVDYIFKIGIKYRIIYDDKGYKPVSKTGKIISKENTLIKLDNGEVLNTQYIIRATEVK